jgi:hypothetical protein
MILLAWWFVFAVGTSSGLAGPFETQHGCEKVRAAFHSHFVAPPASTLPCVSDRAAGDT